jgi:hypothetical protein
MSKFYIKIVAYELIIERNLLLVIYFGFKKLIKLLIAFETHDVN